jgi:hypothetical protein
MSTPKPGEGGWLVAAVEPLCPFCGETLLTSAHVANGVEELKQEVSPLEKNAPRRGHAAPPESADP